MTKRKSRNPSNESRDVTEIVVEGALTIRNASQWHLRFVEAIGTDLPIQLVLDELNEIDAAGIQLLGSLQKSARKRGHEVFLRGASEAFHTALATAGLEIAQLESCENTDSRGNG